MTMESLHIAHTPSDTYTHTHLLTLNLIWIVSEQVWASHGIQSIEVSQMKEGCLKYVALSQNFIQIE